jgi:DNA replication protein DnaC
MKDIKSVLTNDNIEFDKSLQKDVLNPNYQCTVCKGLKYCNQGHVGFYIENEIKQRCKYNLRGTYNNVQILEDKYNKFHCANLKEIKNHINTKHSIYIWGKYGLGKSHMLYWLANTYNLRGKNVYINLMAEISNILKREVAHSKVTGEVLISETTIMKNVEILFIDDIGNERMTDFIGEALQVVIDHRYLKNKPTFISSNYSTTELFNVYTRAIGSVKAGQLLSRIKTFGVIKIEGKNWRGSE